MAKDPLVKPSTFPNEKLTVIKSPTLPFALSTYTTGVFSSSTIEENSGEWIPLSDGCVSVAETGSTNSAQTAKNARSAQIRFFICFNLSLLFLFLFLIVIHNIFIPRRTNNGNNEHNSDNDCGNNQQNAAA